MANKITLKLNVEDICFIHKALECRKYEYKDQLEKEGFFNRNGNIKKNLTKEQKERLTIICAYINKYTTLADELALSLPGLEETK